MEKEVSENLFYENLVQKSLTREEVLEARFNFVGFFDLLYRIDKRESLKHLEESSDLSSQK